jgi:hypothetical protein
MRGEGRKEGLRFLLGSLPDILDLHPGLQGTILSKALEREKLPRRTGWSALSRNCRALLHSTII